MNDQAYFYVNIPVGIVTFTPTIAVASKEVSDLSYEVRLKGFKTSVI